MSNRLWALRSALVLAVAATACGKPEQRVVDQYFNAVNAQDDQTLSSFAAVKFDQKVDKWSIVSVSPEQRSPATLPGLVQAAKEVDDQIAANKKEANAYALEHLADVDKVRELTRKEARIPGNLAGVAAEWEKFNQKDRDLKKAQAEAKEAVEKEKRAVRLSVGDMADVESLGGDMSTKQVELQLTIKGEPKLYSMELKKYDLEAGEGQGRVVSRWVINSLTPKA